MLPSEGSREESFLASSQLLVATGTPWHSWLVAAHLLSLPPSLHGVLPSGVHLCNQFPSSYKNTSHCVRAHPNPTRLHLKWITSTRTLLLNKITFKGTGGLGLEGISLRRHSSTTTLPKWGDGNSDYLELDIHWCTFSIGQVLFALRLGLEDIPCSSIFCIQAQGALLCFFWLIVFIPGRPPYRSERGSLFSDSVTTFPATGWAIQAGHTP